MSLTNWFHFPSRRNQEFDRGAREAAATRSGRQRRRRPGFDALEGRQLMTLGTVPFQVNLFSTNIQRTSAVATAPDGRSVVVWAEQAPFNSDQANIRGRLIGADGVPIGSDLVIANTPLDESDPAVAINAQGNFVVSWTRREDGGRLDIRAQRFTANGAKVGGAILVSSLSDGSRINQDSDLVVRPDGSFIVTYTRQGVGAVNGDDPLDRGVVVQRFSSAGGLQTTSVIDSTMFSEEESSVAVSPSGAFFVAYTREGLGASGVPDVVMQRYSIGGARIGEVGVAQTPVEERDPDLGVDAFGNVVVAYQKFVNGTTTIAAKRVTGGTILGSEITISNAPIFFAFDPEVAVNRSTGAFVVTHGRVQINGTYRAEAVEVSSTNTIVARHDFHDGDDDPHVAMDDRGNYLVTFTEPIGSDRNILARRGRLT